MDSALHWITRLISLDTTSRGSNLALIDVVGHETRRLGLKPTILPSDDGTKANLVVTIPAYDGSTSGGVALSGHTDTVPVDGQRWASDPFTANIRGTRLYGRGASDMKSFLGVALAALPALAATPLREPVHLLLSYDEEVGCGGAARMVAALAGLGVRPTSCFVGEPTGMRVIAAHKSINVLELTAHGVASHSSLTTRGVNAVEYAARAVVFVRSIADEFRDTGPYDDAYPVPYTTASVNVIAGGTAENIVADTCRVELEFRTIAADDPDAISARIQACCDALQAEMQRENPAARIELTTRAKVPGLETDPRSSAVALGALLGGAPSAAKVTFGTEGGLFQAAGIETVVCGPGNIEQAHTADEFIELDQVRACKAFMDTLVQHLDTSTNATPNLRAKRPETIGATR